MTYLIAHTSKTGRDIAQAHIDAKTEKAALKSFAEKYPEREVWTVGIRGVA